MGRITAIFLKGLVALLPFAVDGDGGCCVVARVDD
jgi:hypothetical protein